MRLFLLVLAAALLIAPAASAQTTDYTKTEGLSEGEAGTGSVSFAGDPGGHTDPQGTGAAEFATAPYTEDVVLAGRPEMDLAASVTAPACT